jgi:ubiquitin-protein ligase
VIEEIEFLLHNPNCEDFIENKEAADLFQENKDLFALKIKEWINLHASDC